MQLSRPLDSKNARVVRSSHHVCFACRKTFKKPATTKNGWVVLQGHEYSCPDCKQPMQAIGKNFRAPRQENKRAWHLIERLYAAGYRFNSSLEGNVPRHVVDLKAFLVARKRTI